jgi:hypothetical protein
MGPGPMGYGPMGCAWPMGHGLWAHGLYPAQGPQAMGQDLGP